MLPISFPEENREPLQKPEGWTDEQCLSLPVWSDGSQYFSCWQPSKEDIEAIIAGKPIWLNIIGAGHPPVWLTTDYPFVNLESLMDYVFIKDMQPEMLLENQKVVPIPGFPVVKKGSYLRKIHESCYQVYSDKGIIDDRLSFTLIDLISDYIEPLKKSS